MRRLIARWPTKRALLVACWIGLLALAIMIAGVVLGTPLPVVASMSLAQGLGVLACLLFAVSIAADGVARCGGDK